MAELNPSFSEESISGLEELIQPGVSLSMEDGLMHPMSSNFPIEKKYTSPRASISTVLNNDLAGVGIVTSLQACADETNFDSLTRNIVSGYINAFNLFNNSINQSFMSYSKKLDSPESTQSDKEDDLKNIKSKAEKLMFGVTGLELMLKRDNNYSYDSSFAKSLKVLNNSISTFWKDLILLDYNTSNPSLLSAVSDLCYIRKTLKGDKDSDKVHALDEIISAMKGATKINDGKHETYVLNQVISPQHHSHEFYGRGVALKIVGDDVPTYIMTIHDGKKKKTDLFVASPYHISTACEYSDADLLAKDMSRIISFFENLPSSSKKVGMHALYEFMEGTRSGKYQIPNELSTWQVSSVKLIAENIVLFYSPELNMCVTRNGKPESLRVLRDTTPSDICAHFSLKGSYGDGSELASYIEKRNFN